MAGICGSSGSFVLPGESLLSPVGSGEPVILQSLEVGETGHFAELADKPELDADGLAILGMGDIFTLLERTDVCAIPKVCP